MSGTITKNTLKNGTTSWGYVYCAGKTANGKRRQITKQGFLTKREADTALRNELLKWKEELNRSKSEIIDFPLVDATKELATVHEFLSRKGLLEEYLNESGASL